MTRSTQDAFDFLESLEADFTSKAVDENVTYSATEASWSRLVEFCSAAGFPFPYECQILLENKPLENVSRRCKCITFIEALSERDTKALYVWYTDCILNLCVMKELTYSSLYEVPFKGYTGKTNFLRLLEGIPLGMDAWVGEFHSFLARLSIDDASSK